MALDNAAFAAIFNEIADLLELQDANPFRVRAYRNAAREIGALTRSVAAMVDANEDLDAIACIGVDLAAKLREIAATGTCRLLQDLHRAVPPSMVDLLELPGIGPKRIRTLHEALGVETLDELREAAETGRVRALPGFGERTEAHILEAIRARRAATKRYTRPFAEAAAEPLVAYLRAFSGIDAAEVAGSYRRMRDTVGDLDVLVAAADPARAMRHFVDYPKIATVTASGLTRASVVLENGIQVDARVIEPAQWGAALVYFTGSKAHNIALRAIARNRRLKINEYGVFRVDARIAGATEESVYASIGLAWMPPELRENRGEIELARSRELPVLIEASDLRGDLHAHTRASDGRASLREMALAARERGLEYLAITDHSKRLAIAHGLDAERLARQIDEIDRVNDELGGIVLLKGIEVDILPDGTLDLPDTILARLDLVVGAVHGQFGLSRDKQTERIRRAMDRPNFTILAHPSGRLIGERDPYDVDLAALVAHARERGCFVELDAQPSRLDLDDLGCRLAREAGVLVAIDSDAHGTAELDNLRFGIGQARRGWLRKEDVLNTRTLAQLRPLLARTMSRPRALGCVR